MTITNTMQRQPTKLDYASPTQFKFQIQKLPKVEYFTTACNIPGISLNATVQPTPLADIPLPGDTISFGDLEITFLVDENLENYQELHRWIRAIGFPKERTEFKNFREDNVDRFPTGNTKSIPSDSVKPRTSDSAMYSDATLTILSNKNNPVVNILFSNVYPVSLSSLQYTNDSTDTEYLSATATFQYQIYDFENLKKP